MLFNYVLLIDKLVLTDLKLEDNAHWYNPGQLYIMHSQKDNQYRSRNWIKYYIDPISMIISKFKEPNNQILFHLL
jgi:hypothetical protein